MWCSRQEAGADRRPVAVAVMLALWMGGIAPDASAFPLRRDCSSEIETTLIELGIRLTDYDSLTVEDIRRESGGDDRIVGYRAWIDLRGCEGWLVVELSETCSVRQVYTRGRCTLPVTRGAGAIEGDGASGPRRPPPAVDPLLADPD